MCSRFYIYNKKKHNLIFVLRLTFLLRQTFHIYRQQRLTLCANRAQLLGLGLNFPIFMFSMTTRNRSAVASICHINFSHSCVRSHLVDAERTITPDVCVVGDDNNNMCGTQSKPHQKRAPPDFQQLGEGKALENRR